MQETMSEHRTRVFGMSESVPVRSRKGRSTFKVTRHHRRYLTGPDPVRETIARLVDPATVTAELETVDVDAVRLDTLTLAAIADAWIVANDPAMDRPCTCDDLSDTWIITRRGVVTWDPDAQSYVTRERRVRRCHCRPFPALLGSDLGRSWQEMTPRQMATGRPVARMRLRFPRARKSESWSRVEHADGSITTYDEHGRIVAPALVADRRERPAMVTCEACHGTGGTSGPFPIGDASEHAWAATIPLPRRAEAARGWMALPRGIVRPCDQCHGSGTVPGRVVERTAARPYAAYWSGHVLARRAPSVREARQAASDAHVAATATPEASRWDECARTLSEALSAGETSLVLNGVHVRLTLPAGGRFRATLTYCDGTTRTVQARTVGPVARAVMA